MTTLTTGSELPLMGILFFVAGNAARAEFNLIKVAFVASLAFYFFMRAAQREFGVFCMIEVQSFPF